MRTANIRVVVWLAAAIAARAQVVVTDDTGQAALFQTALRLPAMSPTPKDGRNWILWREGAPMSGRPATGAARGLAAGGSRVYWNTPNGAAVALDWETGSVREFPGQVISANGRWLVNASTGERLDLLTNARSATGLNRVLGVSNDGRVGGVRGSQLTLWTETGDLPFRGGTLSPDGKFEATSVCVANCFGISFSRVLGLSVTLIGGEPVVLRAGYIGITSGGHYVVGAGAGALFLYSPATGERRDLPPSAVAVDVSGDGRFALLLDAASGLSRLELASGAVTELIPPRPSLHSYFGRNIAVSGSVKAMGGFGLDDPRLGFTLNELPLEVVARLPAYVQVRVPAGLRYGFQTLRVNGSRSPLVADGDPVDRTQVYVGACALEFVDLPVQRPQPDAEGRVTMRIAGVGPPEFIEYKLRSLDVLYGTVGRLTGFLGDDRREDMPMRQVEPGIWEVTFPYRALPFRLEFGRECATAVVP